VKREGEFARKIADKTFYFEKIFCLKSILPPGDRTPFHRHIRRVHRKLRSPGNGKAAGDV
jgi:hypothetical protein